ncbi:hypothetical protein ACFW1A_39090 [Kitasatospora sp. NPDC058965]|uniref:hypothetical protein n=1 Tax=Kitasatospora sp. NPDC058965 TaxID=3346682 RepID=UPI0036784030
MTLAQRIGRGLLSAAALVSLSVVPAGLGAVPAAATPVAAPVPADLAGAGPFADTFQLDPALNTSPLYGLNVGLDQRQRGSVRTVSWSRVSGLWNTSVPPASWFVQAGNQGFPNRMVFAAGTSAAMLGAPAIADATGTFTVSTVVDPVVGDTTSADWASVVLSRSHRSTGYVTNGDVDLGLTVSSGGRLALFHGGGGDTPFWTGSVAAAEKYAVSLTVSSGADRALTLTVNGTPFAVTAPASVTRWPSSAFLYLGAYLSNSSEVTAFGDGAGTGVSVSRVDASATAGAKPFVDTFDGAPAGSDYGLDDDLSARQPTLVSADYTAVSGAKGLPVTPPAGAVRVNSPANPNVLSFPQGTAAVRLNKPATADLSGAYTVHARITPATGRTTGPDAASLSISNASGTAGAPDAPDVALGLQVQAGGAVTLYQGGQQLPLTTGSVTPTANGYDVSVAVAGGSTQQATVTVNGTTVFAGPTPGPLPRDGYVALGAQHTTPGVVSTADDLRVSMLGGLDYYGYFDIMDPSDNVDHSPEVAPWTNMNNFIGQDLTQPAASGFLDYCLPSSCVLDVSREVFTGSGPNPDAPAALAALATRIGSNLDKISAIYLLDEPYVHGLNAQQVQDEANQVRAVFPGKMLAYTTDVGTHQVNGVAVSDLTSPVPAGVDLVGFDHYCHGRGTLQQEIDALQGVLASPDQHLVLFPESLNVAGFDCAGVPDATVAANNADYRSLAALNPRVVYLNNFRWLGAQYAATTMPVTTQEQQTLGKAVVNATPRGPAAGVGVYRPGDRTVSVDSHNGTYLGTAGGPALFTEADDIPLTGHWTGPGTDTIGVYHPDTQTFVLTSDNATPAITAKFGNPGDVPVVGDWFGQGRTTIGVYRPSNRTFYLSNDNAVTADAISYGNSGWTPLVGNWSGNGTTTIGAYDPSTRTFYLSDSNTSGVANHVVTFGNPGDIPIKGDWDGSGRDTVGIYRPGDRGFYGAAKDSILTVYGTQFGNTGDVPLVGNWG